MCLGLGSGSTCTASDLMKSDRMSRIRCDTLTATHCNTLQHTATRHTTTHNNTLQHTKAIEWVEFYVPLSLQHTATHCNTLNTTHDNTQQTQQHTATHKSDRVSRILCDILTATHYNTLQHTATHCNTTHGNTQQHTRAIEWVELTVKLSLQHIATHCNTTHSNTQQHTATHSNTLQHTATHCRWI